MKSLNVIVDPSFVTFEQSFLVSQNVEYQVIL